MTEIKQIKNEQWSVADINTRIENKEIVKDKFQRPKKWSILPDNKTERASVREFIDFLSETQNSVHAITFGKKNNEYSNIDGNNRLNAITFYLNNPFEVYPEYLNELKEFVVNNYDIEIHKELMELFSKLKYNEIVNFRYQTYFDELKNEKLNYTNHLKKFKNE